MYFGWVLFCKNNKKKPVPNGTGEKQR
jgi:hypothetical protein